jgi:hypothetical protein
VSHRQMRLALALGLIVLAGCRSQTGVAGPAGPDGAAGPAGPAGAQGAQGPAGPQGPPGQVLVVDGGVLTGPPGAGVEVRPIAPGDMNCPTGGIRVTQESDGGVTNVCNGAAGPTGVPGPTGPSGPSGAQGPAGAAGAQGAPGPAGAPGLPGATGPQGPPGSVLYFDGGVAVVDLSASFFAGFTSATTTGNTGGLIAAHAMCSAQFAGSHLCTDYEFVASTPAVPLAASGAWVDPSDSNNDRLAPGTCNGWSYGGSTFEGAFYVALPTGYVSGSPTSFSCASTLPLACCYGHQPAKFRGFTTATTTGNTGGLIAAHSMCRAQFASSHLCTDYEFFGSNPSVALSAAAAWVDPSDSSNQRVSPGNCNGWIYGGATFEAGFYLALPTGYTSDSPNGFSCASTLPLACCQ